VARLHRLVESRQRQVRIVALSATLPNYDDVADFLQVPDRGVFYFGPEHRPVPLKQTFIGIKVNVKDRKQKEKRMNDICFDEVLDSLKRGYQVMVFVHSRRGTGDTAAALADLAIEEGVLEQHFVTKGKEDQRGDAHSRYSDRVKKSQNREVGTHFANGMGIHHAGMLRGDRKLTEQMFNDGAIKVLCCTATLAWGINLPAHSVIIKGTEVYNPEKGGIVDLSILDVQQIFGRAGRPQFDSSGEATLITTGEAFPRYMDKLVRPMPIESNFIKQLADHLNAEVVSGTVSTLKEAARWLTYTYLYVRMLRNPLVYGISGDEIAEDPMLRNKCMDLVMNAAKLLDATKMIRASIATGNLSAIDKGRVAAHFYIQAESISTFNDMLRGDLPDTDLFRVVCSAEEFRNMKLRPDEMDELHGLSKSDCPFRIPGAGKDDNNIALVTGSVDKAFILMQAYISKARIRNFTLISDTNYIASNAGRVTRALFEICLRSHYAGAALKLLRIATSVEKQLWWFKTPLRQFGDEFKESVYRAIEGRSKGRSWASFDSAIDLLDMQPSEVGQIATLNRDGGIKVQRMIGMLPNFTVTYMVKPITSSVLRFRVDLNVNFEWVGRWHGGAQSFWMWLENGDKILHHEQFIVSWKTCDEPITIDFSIPLFGSSTEQYFIRVVSDSWVGVELLIPVSVDDIDIPVEKTISTELFDLTPLPTSALNNPKYEQLYTKFTTFNPVCLTRNTLICS
jgi:activating signal cointegrator complex subunit 3